MLSAVPAPVAAQLSPPSEALGGHDLGGHDQALKCMFFFGDFAYLYPKKIDRITVYYCNLKQESAGEPTEMKVTGRGGG